MPHMLTMAALQPRYPMPFLILLESDYRPLHPSLLRRIP
jgi:hypothetical protein